MAATSSGFLSSIAAMSSMGIRAFFSKMRSNSSISIHLFMYIWFDYIIIAAGLHLFFCRETQNTPTPKRGGVMVRSAYCFRRVGITTGL